MRNYPTLVFLVTLSMFGTDLARGEEPTLRAILKVPPAVPFGRAKNSVLSVAFSPDGTLLAAGSSQPSRRGGGTDGVVTLWDVKTSKETATLKRHTNSVQSVVFSRDGTLLASGSLDGTIKLWDIPTSEKSDK
jgi:WD40 repeat protein